MHEKTYWINQLWITDSGVFRRTLQIIYTDCITHCSGPMYIVSKTQNRHVMFPVQLNNLTVRELSLTLHIPVKYVIKYYIESCGKPKCTLDYPWVHFEHSVCVVFVYRRTGWCYLLWETLLTGPCKYTVHCYIIITIFFYCVYRYYYFDTIN